MHGPNAKQWDKHVVKQYCEANCIEDKEVKSRKKCDIKTVNQTQASVKSGLLPSLWLFWSYWFQVMTFVCHILKQPNAIHLLLGNHRVYLFKVLGIILILVRPDVKGFQTAFKLLF